MIYLLIIANSYILFLQFFVLIHNNRDKLSYAEAVDFVSKCRSSGKSASETSKLLVEDAIERGSLDNVTAIVVYINPIFPVPSRAMRKSSSPNPNGSILSIHGGGGEGKHNYINHNDNDEVEGLMDVYEFLRYIYITQLFCRSIYRSLTISSHLLLLYLY